jgi:hypothetical protein
MAQGTTRTKTDRFRNTTSGNVGVITVNRRGEEVAIAVPPYGEVDLTIEEQELTANAPQDPARSPFEPQEIVESNEAGEAVSTDTRPLLEMVTRKRPVPGKQQTPKGTRNPKEVVGA